MYYKMFLLGTQLLENRRLNKRIGPDPSKLVNTNEKRVRGCNWVSKSSQPV